MARLLAAVDLEETLERVVATARYLQGGLGMPAELLYVVPSAYVEALARRFPEIAQDLEEALSLAEARVREALEETGLPARVFRGFPAQVVAGEALKSRLVLLGQRGTGTLEALARVASPATSSTGGRSRSSSSPKPWKGWAASPWAWTIAPLASPPSGWPRPGGRPWGPRSSASTW